MIDVLYLGSGPAEEEVAQVGKDDYPVRSREECRRYIDQLKKVFGPLINELGLDNENVHFALNVEYHEDTRRDVVVKFTDDTQIAVEVSYFIENHSPRHWDDSHVYTKDEFIKWRENS